MSLPRQDICPFCTTYENLRLQATQETKSRTTFWCVLRVRKHPWKQVIGGKKFYDITIRQDRLHYCPRCGRQLIALRHRMSKNGYPIVDGDDEE